MNRTQLIESVANRAGVSIEQAGLVVNAFTDEVAACVRRGEQVKVTGFGIFEKRHRAARLGRNPATGVRVKVKGMHYPHFRPGTDFKEIVAGVKKPAKPVKVAVPATAKHAPVVKVAGRTRKAAATTAPAAKKASATTAPPAKKVTPAKAEVRRPRARSGRPDEAATARAPKGSTGRAGRAQV